ncbi:AI-2 transport protein TqsA [Clostridium tepidiprofundi DSM 19306]|uniref:AI-2 transport protein TqsA n=1 Tax=Clostridium tepidiprofundi DSM 19306 TaxID=1121338 RepID=A0A151B407_9CLOT|nr:AI-2E family transporter [Clostridium tepidiprofundi]KYH34626.1 AI-2 transport protein TqsA [Clostridium tepidiprofundi DSM 19306]
MFNKFKIPYGNFLPIIIISIIFYKVINNIEVVTHGFGVLLSYISAVFWGLAIAYLLNPLMMFIEKKLKTKRAISVLIVYIIVSGAIILLITIISPKIVDSVRDLTDSMPTYATQLEHWFNDILTKSKAPNTEGITQYLQNSLNSFVQSSTNFIKNNLNTGLNAAFSKAIDFTSSFIKVIFGFIIAVYLLKDKEKFVTSLKKLIYALLKQDTADNFINFGREVNVIFSKYVIGKSIDSLIIGLLCFVILSIFRVPFASLISVIIGVTNMIPYFGPIIGAVPSVLIILFASPLKALTVLIIIIVLQQFDGWFLGPKILGSQVGLSPFWIILAILIGGGIFGVVGMFLGVPIMAVLKSFGERFVNRRIANKNIDI